MRDKERAKTDLPFVFAKAFPFTTGSIEALIANRRFTFPTAEELELNSPLNKASPLNLITETKRICQFRFSEYGPGSTAGRAVQQAAQWLVREVHVNLLGLRARRTKRPPNRTTF